jgi:hypothetical protein
MIGQISGGSGIEVAYGALTLPYVTPNSNNPIQGMLRIHNTTLQVFVGTDWLSVSLPPTQVSVNSDTRELLEWAREKRKREAELEALMQQHPGLRDLHDRFEIFRTLCEKDAA